VNINQVRGFADCTLHDKATNAESKIKMLVGTVVSGDLIGRQQRPTRCSARIHRFRGSSVIGCKVDVLTSSSTSMLPAIRTTQHPTRRKAE